MLLERDDLVAVFTDALSRAVEGTGALALVGGEAGSGKTALLRLVASDVRPPVRVLVGACDPIATPRPLGPLRDIAADPSSQLGDHVDKTSSPIDVFDAFSAELRATPTLLLLEDLHWADDATLDLLVYLGRRIADLPVVAAASYRHDEVVGDHPLRAVLGRLGRERSTISIVVPALSVTAVARLVGDADLDPAELHRLTGGNAFYTTELIATAGVRTDSIDAAVLARIAGLDDDAREAVETLSIFRRGATAADLAPFGHDVDALDRALRSGVMERDLDLLRFRHELARSVVEQSMWPQRRRDLHRSLLVRLQAAPSTDLATLAHHATMTDDPAVIVEYAPRAARSASQLGANKQAVAFYAAALQHSELFEPGERAELLVEYAAKLMTVDRHAAAFDAYAAAVALYAELEATLEVGHTTALMSVALWRLPDLAGAAETVAEAIAILEPCGPSTELAHAWNSASFFHMLGRRHGPACAAVERAQDIAATVGDESMVRRAAIQRATIELATGAPRPGADRLLAYAEESTDPVTHAVLLSNLGSGCGERRLYDLAIPAIERAIRFADAGEFLMTLSYSLAWAARVAFEQGRWEAATEWVGRTGWPTVDLSEFTRATAAGVVGRLRVRRGDPGVDDALAGIVSLDTELQHVWPAAAGMAEHAWLSGDAAGIAAAIEPSFRRALETDSEWARGETAFWAWRAGLIDRAPENCAPPFAAQIAGNWAGAAALWADLGCPYEQAMALADGDEGAMRQALVVFDELGARPAAAIVRQRLRAGGARRVPRGPVASTRDDPAGLTKRQREVLSLMMAGASNGEIAEALFVSKKTVEHHVSAILSKLGADNRSRAIAVAYERGLGVGEDGRR